jgi:chemotaxis protein MotB
MRRHREEPTNHEAWAIPYGDLITLLLAFFVVMYAMSSVNEGKYRVLSDALSAEFRGTPRSMEPIQVGEKQLGSGADIAMSIVQQEMLHGQPRDLLMSKREQAEAERTVKTEAELDKVAKDVETAMASLINANLLAVRRHGLAVEVEIQTDILFGSGAASLSPIATGVLIKLADAIKPFDNPVRVEGHTDNIPINTAAFPSNWELSATRAAKVVQLFTKHGIDRKRLTVIGMGDNQPLQSNDTPEGRNANRRVVLVILGTDGSSEEGGDEHGKNEPPVAAGDVNGVIQSSPVANAVQNATRQ